MLKYTKALKLGLEKNQVTKKSPAGRLSFFALL